MLIEVVLAVLATGALGVMIWDIVRNRARGRLWSCLSLVLATMLLLASGHAVVHVYGRVAVTAYVVGFSLLVYSVHARHTVDAAADNDDDRSVVV